MPPPKPPKPEYRLETVLFIHRPDGHYPKPFWQDCEHRNVQRLVVEVFSKRGEAKLYVFGVDPDLREIVFYTEVRDAQQKALLLRVILMGVADRHVKAREVPSDKYYANEAKARPSAPLHEVALTAAITSGSAEDRAADPNTVVVAPGGPGGTGPKITVVIGVAVAISATADLATNDGQSP